MAPDECPECERLSKGSIDADYAAQVARHTADRATDAYRAHIRIHGGDD